MDQILRIQMGAAAGPSAKAEPVGAYAGMGGRALTSTLVAGEVPPTCHPLGAVAAAPCTCGCDVFAARLQPQSTSQTS
jgi:hypothetical protein